MPLCMQAIHLHIYMHYKYTYKSIKYIQESVSGIIIQNIGVFLLSKYFLDKLLILIFKLVCQ